MGGPYRNKMRILVFIIQELIHAATVPCEVVLDKQAANTFLRRQIRASSGFRLFTERFQPADLEEECPLEEGCPQAETEGWPDSKEEVYREVNESKVDSLRWPYQTCLAAVKKE